MENTFDGVENECNDSDKVEEETNKIDKISMDTVHRESCPYRKKC